MEDPMEVDVAQSFSIKLNRKAGGAIIKGQVEVWDLDDNDEPELVTIFPLVGVTKRTETVPCHLEAGKSYYCIFRSRMVESANGIYDWEFFVNDTRVAFTNGNVDTTASTIDTVALKSPFILTVS